MGSTNEAVLFINEGIPLRELVPSFFDGARNVIAIQDTCTFLALEEQRDGTEPDPEHHDSISPAHAVSLLSDWPTGGCVVAFPDLTTKTKRDVCVTFLTQSDHVADIILIQQTAKETWREFVELACRLFARTEEAERLIAGWELERKCRASGERHTLAAQYRDAYPARGPNSIVEIRSL